MRRILLAALAVLVALAAPAAAHGDTGTMEVVRAEVTEGLTARVEVGVLHEDGDLAEEATVKATLRHVDGTTVGPVALEPVSGARYGATVELPRAGEWTLTARSTGPEAEATSTFTAEADAPATTLATTSTTAEAEPVADEEEDEDEVGIATFLVPGLVLLAVLALYVGYRRKRLA